MLLLKMIRTTFLFFLATRKRTRQEVMYGRYVRVPKGKIHQLYYFKLEEMSEEGKENKHTHSLVVYKILLNTFKVQVPEFLIFRCANENCLGKAGQVVGRNNPL